MKEEIGWAEFNSMKHIEQIKSLMSQSKSISELTDAIKNADIPAWYMIEADESFKKEHDINVNEKWHRFFAETDSTPVNQWENLPHYTNIIIRDDLTEIRII